MTKGTIHPSRYGSRLSLIRALLVVGLLQLLQPVAAATFVTLNDGRVHVFPAECVGSVTDGDGRVTFTAIDGMDYVYNLADVLSIGGEPSRELPAISDYWIDDILNYQVVTAAHGLIDGDTIRLEVGGIGKRLTASFALTDTAAVVHVDGVEQESGVSRLRFDTDKVYTVGYPGDMILTAAADGICVMQPYGRQYIVAVDFLTDHSTTVPRVDINTADSVDITSREVFIDAQLVVDGAGVYPSMNEPVMVRGRGNASWSSNPAAKNPYRLKFAAKKRPLGLARGKNWVLLANKIYGSMLTNAIGMKAASLLGTVAANHIIPVDLYINGKYKGNYNFTEKVGFASNSVDVDDESVAVLLELDRYYDEAEGQKFRSTPRNIPVNVKSPNFVEDATPVTLGMVSERFNAFVAAVVNGEDISSHVDIDALARYLLLNELICNKEIFHPKSTFCYYDDVTDADSRLVFGPVWDLDWGCGYVGYSPASYFTQLIDYDFFNRVYNGDQYEFFSKLSRNEKLSRRMYELWCDFMAEGLDELCEFCKDYYDYAAPSLTKSQTEAYGDSVDYEIQAANAAVWLRARAEMIYHNRWVGQLQPGDVDGDGAVSMNDVVQLIYYILENQPDPFVVEKADVDGDARVTVGDVTTLISRLLAGGNLADGGFFEGKSLMKPRY